MHSVYQAETRRSRRRNVALLNSLIIKQRNIPARGEKVARSLKRSCAASHAPICAKFHKLITDSASMAPTSVPKYSPFDLKSATVLLTGGSSGIGQELAKNFIEAGSTVIITGRREQALKDAQAKQPKLKYVVNDVSQVSEREKLAKWIVANHPEVNVLVNNAGIQRRVSLKDDNDWSTRYTEIATNVEAPVHLIQLLTPHFLKKKEAAFVNLGSLLGFVPTGAAPVYGATKAFVHSFTVACRFQYAKTNIRFVEIVPPAVKSNLGGSHDYGEECDEFCEHVFKRFAAGEAEVGFRMSEQGRLADRAGLDHRAEAMFEEMGKEISVFDSQS